MSTIPATSARRGSGPRPPARPGCLRGWRFPTASTALAAVLLPLASCGDGFRQEEAFQGEIEIPEGVRKVRISIPNGAVTVGIGSTPGVVTYDVYTLRQGADAEALARLRELEIEPRPVPGGTAVLTITSPDLPEDLRTDPESPVPVEQQKNRRNTLVVKGRYLVPVDMDVEVETGRGAVMVRGRSGAVTASTQLGEVDLEDVTGRAVVRTANGNVLIDGHRGPVEAQTGRGDIFAWIRPGDATPTQGMAIDLRTRFGNIQANVPTSFDFELEIRAKRGEIENGFGLPVVEVGPDEVACRGEIGDGGPRMRAVSGFGNVSVRPSEKLD